MQHDPNRINDPWLAPRAGTAVLQSEAGGAVGDLEAGAFASLVLTYVAGAYGIDDTGGLRVVTRFATDMGRPQFERPDAPNYVTAEASNGAVLELRYDLKGHVRPWDKTIQIRVLKGFLREGDEIVVRLGDRRAGSPGLRMQTFCEEDFQFKVLVDPIATGVYTEVRGVPTLQIVAGPASVFRAVMPTGLRVGESFRLSLKAEDRWGNPTRARGATLRLRSDRLIQGLPPSVEFGVDDRARVIEGLTIHAAGDYVVRALDASDVVVATSNPLRVTERAELLPYWGDLHGQSEETIGTRPAEVYFRFARDLAFLDVVGHQGNDFQITRAFYDGLNELSKAFDEAGRFVTLPGYEWSGNTGLGGDRNVYFAEETPSLYRSSHALVPDQSDLDTDCSSAEELFARLSKHDCVVNAHVGGRYADVRVAHDRKLERSMEVHSAWGTFEWLLYDALDLGYRVGLVSNSDDHKGRPGASYPGASAFGAYGGLTCLLLPELTRAHVIDAMRRRRHYGTTGNRMILDVEARFDGDGVEWIDDPALGATASRSARQVSMGAIARAPGDAIALAVKVVGSAPLERVELRRGRDVLETLRPYETPPTSRRLRVTWEGAEVRGRGRQTIWDGELHVAQNRIEHAHAFNFWNPDKPLRRVGDAGLAWSALTTGNHGGFDVLLADGRAGRVRVTTALATLDVAVADVTETPIVIDAGGLARKLSVRRLPEVLSERSLEIERRLPRASAGDSAYWVCVVQEDGFVAWSSPIYVIP